MSAADIYHAAYKRSNVENYAYYGLAAAGGIGAVGSYCLAAPVPLTIGAVALAAIALYVGYLKSGEARGWLRLYTEELQRAAAPPAPVATPAPIFVASQAKEPEPISSIVPPPAAPAPDEIAPFFTETRTATRVEWETVYKGVTISIRVCDALSEQEKGDFDTAHGFRCHYSHYFPTNWNQTDVVHFLKIYNALVGQPYVRSDGILYLPAWRNNDRWPRHITDECRKGWLGIISFLKERGAPEKLKKIILINPFSSENNGDLTKRLTEEDKKQLYELAFPAPLPK
jgi:hypothetical protein